MKTYIRCRLTPELLAKIKMDSKNRNLSVNKYCINKLADMYNLDQLASSKLLDNLTYIQTQGTIINAYARKVNTYGSEAIDLSINACVAKVVRTIINCTELTFLTPKKKKINDVICKHLTSSLTICLSLYDSDLVRQNATENNMKLSSYVRAVLSNPSQYSTKDINIIKKKVHNQTYPIVNNLKQIIYQYEKSGINYDEISKIEKAVAYITSAEQTIIKKLGEIQ